MNKIVHLDWVQEAVENGAEIVTGGTIENGVFMPTILTNVSATSKVSCQEVFAPIVVVNRISSIEEGIAAINDSNYGLQAGIFTNDIQTAFKASKELEVGGVMINDIPTYRVDQMPYGGVKESGTGKEGLKYAIHEMTETKLSRLESIINIKVFFTKNFGWFIKKGTQLNFYSLGTP